MLVSPRLTRRRRHRRKLRLWDYMVHQVTVFTKPGIRYLRDDEFHGTLAAGAVDGTAATPGPGIRDVTDGGSVLSLASGACVIAANALGDPRIYLDSVARVAGRVGIIQIDGTGADLGTSYHGFRDDVGNIPADQGVRIGAGGAIHIYASGVQGPNVGIVSITGVYTLAITHRDPGAYYHIKGEAFTNWTLLGINSSGVRAPLFIGSSPGDGSGAYSINFKRVPARILLPTPLCYDTFTRANGAIGTSETTGPDGAAGPAVTARTWNNRVGTTQIATNKASASALAGGIAIATVDTSTVDTVMQGTLTSAGDEVGLVLRYADADNYIRAEHDGTNMKLIKRVATSETDVISAVVALGAGLVEIHADGTAFELFLNDVKVGATGTISDAGLQTGTEQGLFSTNTGNTQDGFLALPRNTSYDGALNRYSGARP